MGARKCTSTKVVENEQTKLFSSLINILSVCEEKQKEVKRTVEY